MSAWVGVWSLVRVICAYVMNYSSHETVGMFAATMSYFGW